MLVDIGDARSTDEGRRDETPVATGGVRFPVRRSSHSVWELEGTHEATPAGRIVELLGRVPDEGEKVVIDDLELEVEGIEDGSITAVRAGRGR